MKPPEAVPDWAFVAHIRRAQGRKGEVFAEVLTDFPEKFAERRRFWLVAESDAGVRARGEAVTANNPAPREVELAHHWLHKGGVVLHFTGVDSISAAETLAGLLVAIPRGERAALSEDEAYIGDLIGCVLVDGSGSKPIEVGTIEDVDRTAGPAPLLIVRGAQRNEILIPFARAYVRQLDLDNKRVEMNLPEGLVDLNLPESR